MKNNTPIDGAIAFRNVEFRDTSQGGSPVAVINGYFSTVQRDRYSDMVLPSAFNRSLDTTFKLNPVILRNHSSRDRTAGKAVDWGVDKVGPWILGHIDRSDCVEEIIAGNLRGMSWMGIPLDGVIVEDDPQSALKLVQQYGVSAEDLLGVGRVLTDVDLVEVTLTPIPANPYAIFDLQELMLPGTAGQQPASASITPDALQGSPTGKSIFFMPEVRALFEQHSTDLSHYFAGMSRELDPVTFKTSQPAQKETWKVVPFKKYPKASNDTPWSFSADDGKALLGPNGDNWDQFMAAHTVYDSEKSNTKGGYKLPHHKLIDGAMKTVLRGVQAAGGVMMGARGGMNLPDNMMTACKGHLQQEYSMFDVKAPWQKSVEEWQTELANIYTQRKLGEHPVDYDCFSDNELLEMYAQSLREHNPNVPVDSALRMAYADCEQAVSRSLEEQPPHQEDQSHTGGNNPMEDQTPTPAAEGTEETPGADEQPQTPPEGTTEASTPEESTTARQTVLAALDDEEVIQRFTTLIRDVVEQALTAREAESNQPPHSPSEGVPPAEEAGDTPADGGAGKETPDEELLARAKAAAEETVRNVLGESRSTPPRTTHTEGDHPSTPQPSAALSEALSLVNGTNALSAKQRGEARLKLLSASSEGEYAGILQHYGLKTTTD